MNPSGSSQLRWRVCWYGSNGRIVGRWPSSKSPLCNSLPSTRLPAVTQGGRRGPIVVTGFAIAKRRTVSSVRQRPARPFPALRTLIARNVAVEGRHSRVLPVELVAVRTGDDEVHRPCASRAHCRQMETGNSHDRSNAVGPAHASAPFRQMSVARSSARSRRCSSYWFIGLQF